VSFFEQLVIAGYVNGFDATSYRFLPEGGLEGEGGEVGTSYLGYSFSDRHERRT